MGRFQRQLTPVRSKVASPSQFGSKSYLKAAPAVPSPPVFFLDEEMGLSQTTKPIAEPLSAAEAFPHLRLIPVTAASSPDSGNNTQGGDFDNTTDPVSIVSTDYPNISFAVGRLLKIENEILEIVEVDGTAVKVGRGRLESTAEAHADESDIFRGTDAENVTYASLQGNVVMGYTPKKPFQSPVSSLDPSASRIPA